MEEIIQQLWSASNKMRECRLVLEGEPFPRVVQPYGVCQTSANKIVLVCIQTSGFTKGGGTEGYRNLILSKINVVEEIESVFQMAKDFDPTDSQYKEWVYHL